MKALVCCSLSMPLKIWPFFDRAVTSKRRQYKRIILFFNREGTKLFYKMVAVEEFGGF
jgi:hypothetical protein